MCMREESLVQWTATESNCARCEIRDSGGCELNIECASFIDERREIRWLFVLGLLGLACWFIRRFLLVRSILAFV